MPPLIADLFTTLDGFAAGRDAPAYFGYFGPDLERWVLGELDKPQTVVLGRVTYQVLSSLSEHAVDPGARRLTELPKIVVSRTLREPLAWNARLLRSIGEVRALKQTADEPLRTMGSLSLVRQLMEDQLVDRLRLMVFPQILGATGHEPIFTGLPDIDLELVGQEVLDSRLVLLEYRPTEVKRALP
jgi:dihydrofolate reductase